MLVVVLTFLRKEGDIRNFHYRMAVIILRITFCFQLQHILFKQILDFVLNVSFK